MRETLPEGFQRSEFLLEKGAIDQIVDRRELRHRIHLLLVMMRGRKLSVHEGELVDPDDDAGLSPGAGSAWWSPFGCVIEPADHSGRTTDSHERLVRLGDNGAFRWLARLEQRSPESRIELGLERVDRVRKD